MVTAPRRAMAWGVQCPLAGRGTWPRAAERLEAPRDSARSWERGSPESQGQGHGEGVPAAGLPDREGVASRPGGKGTTEAPTPPMRGGSGGCGVRTQGSPKGACALGGDGLAQRRGKRGDRPPPRARAPGSGTRSWPRRPRPRHAGRCVPCAPRVLWVRPARGELGPPGRPPAAATPAAEPSQDSLSAHGAVSPGSGGRACTREGQGSPPLVQRLQGHESRLGLCSLATRPSGRPSEHWLSALWPNAASPGNPGSKRPPFPRQTQECPALHPPR